MNLKKMSAAATAIIAVFAVAATASAATTVVHPGDMQGWGFLQETATGTGTMVAGPGIPPMGNGSANLIVDSTGGIVLAKADYAGLPLTNIDALQYSTYRAVGSSALAIALQFNFDGDVTDANNAFQGRIVYEPYHTQTVNTGVWQTWDALDDAAGTATGNWWGSSNANSTLDDTCPQANPCTWAEVLAAFPNGGVHNTLGAVILKAGGGWTGGFDGNVDALTVNDDVYDFELNEPATTPVSKDECKNGGWMSFNSPTFRNQGQCVSYVQSNEKAGKRN